MIAAIHQPHFLPWLGYLDRMRKADVFVVLDHVQFERENYQNRVRIKTGQGPLWLTVPVKRRSHPEPIADKLVDADGGGGARWALKASRTLAQAYAGTPFYERYAPAVQEVLSASWDRLVELDLRLLEVLREALGIRTPLVRSSTLPASGQKSEMLVSLCKAVGADTYLAGLGGSRGYLDEAAFGRAGIRVLWQEFRHPRYVQRPAPETFVEGLSALDMLFNCGPGAPDGQPVEPPAPAAPEPWEDEDNGD